ncbi:DUF2975 domain-containing protein [Clostridioides sp. GD02377]|uniref:DUF2975 domain-containing protein n=1 Tax=unclassified Clostridioides TaxID=2635829 RepID=UPI0038B0AE7A
MKKNLSSKILNNIVLVGIILTLLSLILVPLVLTTYFKSGVGITDTNMPTVISVAIYICAIPYIVSLFILKKLCKLLAINKPFSKEIPKDLKKISVCAFSEIFIFNFVVIILYYFYDVYLYAITIIPSVIVSFVSLSIGFLTLVLSILFKKIIEIKEENDKTI